LPVSYYTSVHGLAAATDYRDALLEILVKRLNNPALEEIFPGYQSTLRGIVK
jgi:hypothetical protein